VIALRIGLWLFRAGVAIVALALLWSAWQARRPR
jgi:hypothetical protein